MEKDDRAGGRLDRKIESERGLRKGGWWRHMEETMNTKGKSNQKGNQIFIKQLPFPTYNLHFIEIERREVMADVASRRVFPF